MSTVAERIKSRRLEMGLSIAELARRADISKGYLHSIEAGETQSPSAEVLFKIAHELGTTIADLLGEAEALPATDMDIPETLLQLAREDNLTQADIQMLASIRYRGKQPQSIADWRFVFESIKRTVRFSDGQD
jgi:transcriptional regulator with XRE-family HTH domain